MKTNDVLLAVHDGKRLSGKDHFELQNKGLMDRKGALTGAGKAAIKPMLDARANAAAKAKAKK